MVSLKFHYRYILAFFISSIIFFSCYLFFYDLGKAPFDNWDEAWYAETTKQMLNTHNGLVLQWNHQIFFEKPPLSMWLASVFSLVLGLSEFSVRLASALSGFIVCVLVFFFAKKHWGLLAGIIAFLTLSLNNIFIWRARSGNIDLLVTLFIFLSFVLMVSRQKYRYEILGFLFACIYLTKSSLVLFPLGIFLIYQICFERKIWKTQIKHYWGFLGIFIGIPFIWLLLGYMQVGTPMLYYYLLKSDQGVGNFSLQNAKTDYLLYAYYALQRRWFYVFIAGLVLLLCHIRHRTQMLLLFFSTFLLVFLSFNERKNNWYLIPSMPFWSLTIGYTLSWIIIRLKNNIVAIFLLLIFTSYISYKTFSVNILPILSTSSTMDQTQSAKEIKKISQKNDIVIRLDYLFPTTIYYTDRFVLASPPEAGTKNYWISRKDLVTRINNKTVQWLVGTTQDITMFITTHPSLSLKQIYHNNSETIVKVL